MHFSNQISAPIVVNIILHIGRFKQATGVQCASPIQYSKNMGDWPQRLGNQFILTGRHQEAIGEGSVIRGCNAACQTLGFPLCRFVNILFVPDYIKNIF